MTIQRLGPGQTVVLKAEGVLAYMTIGLPVNLSESAQQTADRIMCTDMEMRGGGFAEVPKHGDQCIYDDGRITTVQGRTQVYKLGPDRVFIFHTLGG